MARPRKLRRRTLLQGLFGFPLVAAAGCSGSAGKKLPPQGEIVGAVHERGHRLRNSVVMDRGKASPPTETTKVLIVGGGVAGLSAAWKLKKLGVQDFLLLELEDVAGGTSRGGLAGKQPHPWGAHYLPAPMQENAALVELLEEFGVVERYDAQGEPIYAEEMLCRDPEERLFLAGKWHEGLWPAALGGSEDVEQLQRFMREVERWVRWRDGQGRKAFTLPVSAASDDEEALALDRISFADWLDERGLTAPDLRWWLEYATRDDYGLTLAQTSAWAGLFYYAARVKEKVAEPQPLLTWPEGNGWLVQRLLADVNEHVRTGQTVLRIEASDDDAMHVLALDAKGAPHGYRAQHVIYAAPQFTAPHVIANFPPVRIAAAKTFQYGAWLVANLTLSGRPKNIGFEPAWDNVLRDGEGLGYVTATHQRGRDHGPTVWTYYYPLTDDDPAAARAQLLDSDWEAWAEFVLRDLERAHPDLRPLVERLDVMLWGHAMIQPRVGFLSSTGRRLAAQPWRNIHFAHSDLSGLALFEEAFAQGLRAAEEIMRRETPQ